MTVTAWRIVQARLIGTAFDGEGARRYGGRWNHPGTRVVYTAGSVSLAALELLVHLDRAALLARYVQIPVEIDDRLVHVLDLADLPADWATHPAPAATRDLGTTWIASNQSAVLAVPSCVVPAETVFLLNPQHADFPRVRIGRPVAFALDPRLLKT